jgi:hypothetical protein
MIIMPTHIDAVRVCILHSSFTSPVPFVATHQRQRVQEERGLTAAQRTPELKTDTVLVLQL